MLARIPRPGGAGRRRIRVGMIDMKRWTALATAALTGLGLVAIGAAAASAGPGASQARLTVSWGKALEVPGTGALNVTGQARIGPISCPAAGYCTAAGLFSDKAGHNESFLAGESKGKWGTARRVPGLAKLDLGGQDYVNVVSCAARGYCSAGGNYIDGAAQVQSYVAGQSTGRWGSAKEIPGLGKLNGGGQSSIDTLACAARGACTGGGTYKDAAGHFQAFVVSERKGRWGTAVPARGVAALNSGGSAAISAISCSSPGNCQAGGFYTDAAGRGQPFTLAQAGGHWAKAQPVRGAAKLNAGGDAEINSLSCAAPGSCTAAGYYSPALHQQAPMLVQETKGKWGAAQKVPGAAKLSVNGHAELLDVSCARRADCSAVGYYQDHVGTRALVVSQRKGKWGTAAQIPGLAKLNKNDFAEAESVSCASAGSCTTGGFYFDGGNHQQVFVATELAGTWGRAIELPGSGGLNKGFDSFVYAVACASAGNCSVGGVYKDAGGALQAFVANETVRVRR